MKEISLEQQVSSIMQDLAIRFFNKVEITESCWLWSAHINKDGYGTFRWNNKSGMAHRFSYELLEHKIINGMQLDHLCRVRYCVNPSHLQMVTLQENIKRGKTGHHTNQHKGLNHFRRRKTHCPKGHEYNEENIYYYNGWRNCKKCISIRKKEQYRRKIERNL